MNLKERIAEVELYTRPVLQDLSESKQFTALEVSDAVSEAMEIIKELESIIEIQTKALKFCNAITFPGGRKPLESKMPVVGKRYKTDKGYGGTFEVVAIHHGLIIGYRNYPQPNHNNAHFLEDYSPYQFWNDFEELPSDKPSSKTHGELWGGCQETKCAKCKKEIYKNDSLRHVSPNKNYHLNCFEEDLSKMETTEKTTPYIDSIHNKTDSIHSVEKALEELKQELSINRSCHFTRVEKLQDLGNQLVNALEAQPKDDYKKLRGCLKEYYPEEKVGKKQVEEEKEIEEEKWSEKIPEQGSYEIESFDGKLKYKSTDKLEDKPKSKQPEREESCQNQSESNENLPMGKNILPRSKSIKSIWKDVRIIS